MIDLASDPEAPRANPDGGRQLPTLPAKRIGRDAEQTGERRSAQQFEMVSVAVTRHGKLEPDVVQVPDCWLGREPRSEISALQPDDLDLIRGDDWLRADGRVSVRPEKELGAVDHE